MKILRSSIPPFLSPVLIKQKKTHLRHPAPATETKKAPTDVLALVKPME
jgi:hypothetical protein